MQTRDTRFACARFGNMAWSTGSVLPEWRRMLDETGVIGTTGPHMRRYIITVDRMMTSVPGLFAAGVLRVQLTRQVTTAVGDATTAVIAVEKYLAERRSAAPAGV